MILFSYVIICVYLFSLFNHSFIYSFTHSSHPSNKIIYIFFCHWDNDYDFESEKEVR